MLSAQHRFHGHGSLRYVYKNGQAVRSHLITVKYTSNPYRKHSQRSFWRVLHLKRRGSPINIETSMS